MNKINMIKNIVNKLEFLEVPFIEFIRENHYHVINLGYRDDVFCIFNGKRDIYKKWRIIELIDINHPFIKWIKTINQNNSVNLYDCSAVKIKRKKTNNIENGIYVYFIQKWSADGYRKINELIYFVINTRNNEILNENLSEKFVIDAFSYGSDYLDINYDLNNFDTMVYSMNKLKELADFDFTSFNNTFVNQNNILCERNIQYLERTFNRKIMSIKQQIDKARHNKQLEKIIRMHEGKLKKQKRYSIFKKKNLN